jgi:hypothetical protein
MSHNCWEKTAPAIESLYFVPQEANSIPLRQQAEFIDGLRFSVQTNRSMTMNVDLKQGINPGSLPANTVSLNSYMWIVNTSDPSMRIDAEMLVPCKITFSTTPSKTLSEPN